MTTPQTLSTTTIGKSRSILIFTQLLIFSHLSELLTPWTLNSKLSWEKSTLCSSRSTSVFSQKWSSGGTTELPQRLVPCASPQAGRVKKLNLQLFPKPHSENATKSFWTTLKSHRKFSPTKPKVCLNGANVTCHLQLMLRSMRNLGLRQMLHKLAIG